MTDLPTILQKFSAAAVAADGKGLASLFTPNGTYDDYFFGPHQGRDEIAKMLARFYEGGEQYRWNFVNPLWDSSSGYAQYRFSYVSKAPESAGNIIIFEGMSRFQFEGEQIAHYAEVFDRGMTLTQLGFHPDRIRKILARYAESLRATPGFQAHLTR